MSGSGARARPPQEGVLHLVDRAQAFGRLALALLAVAKGALGQLALGHVVHDTCRKSGSPCSSVTNVVSSCTHTSRPSGWRIRYSPVHEGALADRLDVGLALWLAGALGHELEPQLGLRDDSSGVRP